MLPGEYFEFDMKKLAAESWAYDYLTDDGELHKAVQDAFVKGVNYGDLGRDAEIYELALQSRNSLTNSIEQASNMRMSPTLHEVAGEFAVVGSIGYLQLYYPLDDVFDSNAGDLLIMGSGVDRDDSDWGYVEPDESFDTFLGLYMAALRSKGLTLKAAFLSGPDRVPYTLWTD